MILAAGEGKRMRSDKAKVLHEVAAKPMLMHVLDAVAGLRPSHTIVVVGHQGDAVAAAVGARARCVTQAEQLGTGHAVLQAKSALGGFAGDVLVLCGDVPLISAATLRRLLTRHRRAEAKATVLSMVVDDPTGYGRILGGGSGHVRIVEHADATTEERAVTEVNSGTYVFSSRHLFATLAGLGRDNAQGEYYLTDVLEMASEQSAASKLVLDDQAEGLGVNSRADLAQAERLMQARLVKHHMERGVTFLDPGGVRLSVETRIGRDTTVGPNVRLEGETTIGSGCTLDGASYLKDAVIAAGVHIRWGVVADSVRIDRGARVGPYAHLRPKARLASNVHIGNFVEVKNATIGAGSKANHLAYIGDAVVGRDANIGAGTITCNYDGFDKHQTKIGDRVQIGSDTQLVAPVELGSDCYVAAGSTVTGDVENGALVFNDKRQLVRPGWVAGFRKRAARKRERARNRKRGK